MKIAMWSGPRNLSTAMMYSFAARGDCAAWDEPFYAPYLAATGMDHPLAEEIVAAHEADPEKVAARCAGPIPDGKKHFYMKHMPHHMLPGFPLDWAKGCVNVHLIRHPARVIASYAAKRGRVTLEDIGFPQQLRLWQALPGPVVDSADIRRNPREMLQKICTEIGLDFTESMLHWPPGPRPYDGVWARHWYGAVHASTGFAEAEGPLPELPAELAPLLAQALPIYEEMRAQALAG
ncbi:sulfotransferase [Roseibacterium beibuensis]|uniref:Branched chain amino acid aminotransferase n=1 Tax=[Roseibacterium] beibuensis TaxID=1193142 RepID=A0ABP9LKI9_9RHOB|nr:sulfotransferase [Roseibacterium beibuensis]MCS6626029.1 sulfotransferase [Roseibacterium beibuensis]